MPTSEPPPDEERLAELLLRWEELTNDDVPVDLSELCADCPNLLAELTRRVHALKSMEWMGDSSGREQSHESSLEFLEPPPEPLAGRYRLDQFVAEGGFGQVWRGYDLELQRVVAVKLPKPGHISQTQIDTFIAEARRVAKLRHPGIVPVFDVGSDDQLFFIISDFVEGGTLAARIAQSALQPAEAVRIVTEVAETLHYAHRAGFIHRDIKPSNILLDQDDRALLVDFGIAASPEELESQAGRTLGTLDYMSPEQLKGEQIDARTDVYGLGVVLFESLTGRLPFCEQKPPRLRSEILSGVTEATVSRRLPRDLGAIFLRCVAKNRTDRFEDASELVTALKGWRPANPLLRWIALLMGIVVIGIAVAGVAASRRLYSALAPDLTPMVSATEKAKESANNLKATATSKVLSAKVQTELIAGRAMFDAGDTARAMTHFDRAVKLAPDNPEVLKKRAEARSDMGQLVGAIQDLDLAISLDPDHRSSYEKAKAEAYAARAEQLAKEKNWQSAIDHLSQAIVLDPQEAEYYDARGVLLYNAQKYEASLKDIDEAIRLAPDRPSFQRHRDRVLKSLGMDSTQLGTRQGQALGKDEKQ